MLIGILSDSHGRVRPVQRALKLLDSLGVSHIIHCGDVGGTEIFDEFIGRPFTFVWGNTDFPDSGLLAYLPRVGIKVPSCVPTTLELDGTRFAVFHGHERQFEHFDRIEADFILHGHTHAVRDETIHGLRILNPGALHRAARKTVATVDTSTRLADFHIIHRA